MLNDIVASIRLLQRQKLIKKAWVIDIDVHKGDGTAELTQNDISITTLSIHMQNGWPLDGPESVNGKINPSFIPSDIDIAISQEENDRYLPELAAGLSRLNQLAPQPDIVAIVGGSDPYEGDELPSSSLISLTLEEMLKRDHMVYEFCKKLNVPQFWLMAGGYGENVWKVHSQFLKSVLGC